MAGPSRLDLKLVLVSFSGFGSFLPTLDLALCHVERGGEEREGRGMGETGGAVMP